MQHDYAYIEEWTKRGLLRPLDDEIAAGTLNLSDVLPALVDGGKVGGKVMGIPLGINTQSIVLDTNAFAAAGVALPTDEWTWADFEKIAMDIHTKTGKWGFGTGLHGYTPGWKAVTLSTGTVYYGKLSADGNTLLLDDVYYLAGATEDNPSGSLVKRGAEIYAPNGAMVLNPALVVQIDEIGTNSVIARGIERIASGD